METELKFSLSPDAARRVEADWLADGQTREVVSTYFDTPGLDLRRAGAAIRLRRSGESWVQTLKAGDAGAVSRFEDERPAPEGRLSPEAFDPSALDALLNGARHDLRPIFESRVQRRTLEFTEGDARIEAALDEGCIQAGEATTPVLEFELELKSGAPRALFAAGRRVLAAFDTRLSLTSKAERGYRLAAGHAAEAARFTPPRLDFEAGAAEGFQALALAALHQLCANAERLREVASPEAVHQARVALRHLRTFVKAFKAVVGDGRAADVRDTIRRLTAIFEAARALDVFQTEAFLPLARHEAGAARFGHAVLEARTRAYREVQAAIAGPAFARDVFDLVEWTLCGPWTERPADRGVGAAPLKTVVRRVLRRRWKAMRRRGRKLDWDDAHARHKLRIQGKQLRYLLEALAGPKAAAPELRRLKALQEQLGELNDIATAHDTVRLAYADAPPEAAFAAGCIVGERRAEVGARLRRARRAYHRLAARFDDMTKSDWRRLIRRKPTPRHRA